MMVRISLTEAAQAVIKDLAKIAAEEDWPSVDVLAEVADRIDRDRSVRSRAKARRAHAFGVSE